MGSLPPNPNLFLFLDLPLLECVMWSSGTPNDHLNRGDISGLARLRPCALCPSVLSTDQEVKALRELPKQTDVIWEKNMSVAATEP
jgi:hypothetical protein